ncbi:arsenate reductase (glutaredoxin) [Acetobacter sp.]|jgi:arsenate reductase|uniref:arsenate reductase (glutaredoxin) n=1 Tax=Acetobacter sp. TaxID=440 RepID=UPI0025C5FF2A|nr:arsenate reductase (glutaredoxin) [Acetobacter sp.]MCH4090055.1 arsenate reductase (glutaredoxin) [Acetobacter sp.]MCI1298751.1 arsenate reductase (glutaredoxin) [Acetobacter sp.]MCI1315316.1 arsenate reductase (glutaredoxin) [Acetobacter sp.]
MQATLYHNPRCGTSRKVLDILSSQIPDLIVVDYLKTPPDRSTLLDLAKRLPTGAGSLLRTKEPLATELGLLETGVTEDQILDAILAHPILLNRPVVVTSLGARICRPAEIVQEILPPTA